MRTNHSLRVASLEVDEKLPGSGWNTLHLGGAYVLTHKSVWPHHGNHPTGGNGFVCQPPAGKPFALPGVS